MIKELTERAAGLFIWADTVIRFLQQGFPKKQLERIIKGSFHQGGDAIDHLYRQILQLAFTNNEVLDTVKRVVGAIVLAKIPLRRTDLHHFLGQQEDEASIDFVLESLSSVLSI